MTTPEALMIPDAITRWNLLYAEKDAQRGMVTVIG